MNRLKLSIQYFADGKVVIDTELNTKNFENGLNKIKNSSQKAGTTIKNIVAGLGITKMISSAFSMINSSIDGAIERFDTLNNFPKVMSNLGIGADEAEASIKKMSDKLAGLPTTLDQGAMAVQRFTSKNGDVEESTDIFLALNNAILAGGASSEIQASALEQLSQAYAKGKPDMMEWRTAMTAMPAQLKQVAEAMGYIDADALGEALRDGSASMDDFMDAIKLLNTEGTGNFLSFEKQARNATGGIKTSITVAKTQIVKGVADIVKALDTKFEKLGFGSLSDIISNTGIEVKKALDTIADLIEGKITVSDIVDKATTLIENFIKTINEKIPDIVETGFKIISELITGIGKALPKLIPEAVKAIVTFVTSLLDNIDVIIDAGIQLLMGLIEGIINAIPILVEKAPEIIEKLIEVLISNLPKLMSVGPQLIISLIEGIIKNLDKLITFGPRILIALIEGIIKGIGNIFNSGGTIISKLIEGIKNAFGSLLNIGGEIINTIWEGLKELPNKAVKWGKDFITGFTEGVAEKYSTLKAKVTSMATIIKSIFHFSKPDEGPLREYEKWMPDFIKGLAKTMDSSSYILRNQSEELANEIKKSMDFDDIYSEMQNAVNLETSKMNTSIDVSNANNGIQQMLNASATFEGIIPIEIDLDGEKIYDNQQKITSRKNLQYGGVR